MEASYRCPASVDRGRKMSPQIAPKLEMKTLPKLEANRSFIASSLWQSLRIFDAILTAMVRLYDVMIYSPIEATHAPLLSWIPRVWGVGTLRAHIFTANNVSFFRTFLVIPLALCLKFGAFTSACLLVVLHDYLDHIDGILARVQRSKYGRLDDPVLGGFLDAFCDKIVNCLSLWSILMVTSYKYMTSAEIVLWFTIIGAVISYEFVLGVIRVQDYFRVSYTKPKQPAQCSTAATMEGKLKEKLESIGIAMLCLAAGQRAPLAGLAGLTGLISLVLSLRWAHASLMSKLRARKDNNNNNIMNGNIPNGHPPNEENVKIKEEKGEEKRSLDDTLEEEHHHHAPPSWEDFNSLLSMDIKNIKDCGIQNVDDSGLGSDLRFSPSLDKPRSVRRSLSVGTQFEDFDFDMETQDDDLLTLSGHSHSTGLLHHLGLREKVDKVYTVGCFDLFHRGHIKLMMRMRAIGRKVVVGVHDSRSIYKLKGRAPVQGTGTRMTKVKEYADEVFVISGTDPSIFVKCMVHLEPEETAMYLRGDDMPSFPGREVVERVMPIWLVPYTSGISTTELRRRFYPDAPIHFHDDI